MEPLSQFYILRFNNLPNKIYIVIETIETKDKILIDWAYFFHDINKKDKLKTGRSSHNNHIFNSINEEWKNVVIENLKYEVFKDFITSYKSVYNEKVNSHEFELIDEEMFKPQGYNIKTYNKLIDNFKNKELKHRFETLKGSSAE